MTSGRFVASGKSEQLGSVADCPPTPRTELFDEIPRRLCRTAVRASPQATGARALPANENQYNTNTLGAAN